MKSSVVQQGMKVTIEMDTKQIEKKRLDLEIESRNRQKKTISIQEKFGGSALDKLEEE